MGNELQAVKHLPFYEALQEWFAGDPEICNTFRLRAVVLAGIGHLPSMELPQQFFGAVLSFMNDVFVRKACDS